ncbi:hypothetical protein KKD52_09160 [Myxococcota bacterium]|nr:hypothetical protein [Myxococcota bacterium]MBU1412948.1 hypothetical protein [Myxococcota bacterium]MBU1510516.1 hypothetical protein [Myxococcota bacterium]
MTTTTTKNEPTWLEYLIVYIVLGALAVFVYTSVLSPRGYTFAAGWSTLRGQKKPAGENKAAKKAPEKEKAMEADMPADMAEPEISPMSPTPVVIEKPVEMAPPPPPMPMQLSEDDD